MRQAVSEHTPAHLWIIGALALLWNCLGAYDYVMTRAENLDYVSKSMPGVDPHVALSWIAHMPLYAQVGWGLGVWAGVLGSILLLLRSRHAFVVFAASLIGVLLSIGYQLIAAPPLEGASSSRAMSYVIVAVAAFLLWYSALMARQRRLR